ncbi:restriction endonuclease [uncultured Lentibacter sp.]|uniref:restriction endonuclease n=1 Tax=uncultured Lentibacter sp. TaxID=1659309 RepID=UPI0026376319|nr:restriction endonuclease [uncultured Lentibacter sp.]
MSDLAPIIAFGGCLTAGVLWLANSSLKARIRILENDISRQKQQSLEDKLLAEEGAKKLKNALLEQRGETSQIKTKSEKQKEVIVGLESLILEKNLQFPWLVTAFSDFQEILGKRDEEALRFKTRAAPKAAEKVKEATERAKNAERRYRMLKYRIDFYEKYFPWITEVTGDNLESLLKNSANGVEDDQQPATEDRVQNYLSLEEFKALSLTERNQLALDRWKKNRKSSWEIGRLYERFIGYEYEQQGYTVEYYGAIKGFDDLGRDLIVTKGGKVLIVQCKYWAQEKTIHEKHVFQLFGSVVEYVARQNTIGETKPLFDAFEKLADIRAVFVTSTTLSDRARDFAKLLNVEVREGVPLSDYPLIKCNISKRASERVYHLPFDQQYDRTVIERNTGECYAWSVAEAEASGFRRAFRWRPEAGD